MMIVHLLDEIIMSVYETDKILADYLLMHFGSHEERMPWGLGRLSAIDFPNVTASYFSNKRVDLALDLGCSVGGSAFHLSKSSKKVIAIDLSKKFIEAANELKEKGAITFEYQEEGDINSTTEVTVPEGAEPSKISFAVGDVLNLPEGFKGFDRVHGANLVCRLPDPEKFLKSLGRLLKKDGELVLATPFSWLEEFTPKDKWPTGDSWEWLQATLADDFVCLEHNDEIFTIREHARKFQLGVSKVSLWRKR